LRRVEDAVRAYRELVESLGVGNGHFSLAYRGDTIETNFCDPDSVDWLDAAVFAKPTSLTAFEAKLDRHVSRFDSSGRTLAACVVDLAYEYQLPMAIEFVDRDAMRPLHVEFRNRSVRQVLEDIIRQVPRYRVTFSEGLVDIFTPESRGDPSSPLNAVIRDFAVTEQETRQADFQLLCVLSKQVYDSKFCGGSLAVGQWEPTRITLHLHNAKVYEIVNAIVA
jgi:hypothetical protein